MLLFVACGCNKLAIKFILLWALQTFSGASRNTSGSLHRCVVHFTNVLLINTLRPRKIWRHFANDIFICIFLNGTVWIPIEIALKFVSKGPLNNIPALVQWMAWQHPGFKPLSEAVVVSLPTHTCIYCILNHTYLLYAWITAWMGSNIFFNWIWIWMMQCMYSTWGQLAERNLANHCHSCVSIPPWLESFVIAYAVVLFIGKSLTWTVSVCNGIFR